MMNPASPPCPGCGKTTTVGRDGGLCAVCLLQTALTPGGWDVAGDGAIQNDLSLPLADGYRLVRGIGEGGFGVVYEAEQLGPIRRRVALKILKPGTATAQILARFEAERQALALMDHPHIARVYDAGETDDGRPFIAMELIAGPCINVYARGLGEAAILALFVKVCRAIAHAHHRGVIHRDLKPSNLLIDCSDPAQPQPKVIDFGVAKALDAPLTEAPMFTALRQLVGTPDYMSPEQLAALGPLADTRTDIFALGKILRELLSGKTTHPATPGAVKLPRELTWICQQATHTDASERYASADEFAADIERYLAGRAVKAGPESLLYLVGKWVRQHRAAAAGFILANLVVALALTAMMLSFRETREALRTEQAARRDSAASQQQVRRSFSQSDFEMGLQLAERGRANAAVAQWSRALRTDTGNEAAAMQILAAFAWQDLVRPTGPAVPFDALHVQEIKVSPDGRTVVIIQTAPGQNPNLSRWRSGEENFTRLPFSPRGQLRCMELTNSGCLYLVDAAGVLSMIDAHGKATEPGPQPGGMVHLAVSADGAKIITASAHEVVWHDHAAQPTGEVFRSAMPLVAYKSTADAQQLAVGLEGGGVGLLDFGSREIKLLIRGQFTPSALAIRASDGLVAAADVKGQLRLSSATPPLQLSGAVHSLAFSPNGEILVAELPDGLQAINARTWEILGAIHALTAPIRWVIASDSQRVVVHPANGIVRAWNLRQPAEFEDLQALPPASPFGIAPGGMFCASADPTAGGMRVYDLGSHPLQPLIRQRSATEICLAVNHVTGELWFASQDGQAHPMQTVEEKWDVGKLSYLRQHPLCALNPALGLALHSSDNQLTLLAKAGPVRKWAATKVAGVALSADGKLAASARDDGTVDVWNPDTGQRVSHFAAHSMAVASIAFAGVDQIVTGSVDRTARLFDSRTGRALTPPMNCNAAVTGVAASASGDRIATGTQLGQCRVWSGRSGQALTPAFNISGQLMSLALHPQAQCLWALTSQHALYEWQLPPPTVDIGSWLPDWAEATVGLRLDPDGSFTPNPAPPPIAMPPEAPLALQEWYRSLGVSPPAK